MFYKSISTFFNIKCQIISDNIDVIATIVAPVFKDGKVLIPIEAAAFIMAIITNIGTNGLEDIFAKSITSSPIFSPPIFSLRLA